MMAGANAGNISGEATCAPGNTSIDAMRGHNWALCIKTHCSHPRGTFVSRVCRDRSRSGLDRGGLQKAIAVIAIGERVDTGQSSVI